MSESVFTAVPGLDKVVRSGTKQNVRIIENHCKPGEVNKYSGDFENMIGEIRIDLFRTNSPIDKTTAETLLIKTRNYFYKNTHLQ